MIFYVNFITQFQQSNDAECYTECQRFRMLQKCVECGFRVGLYHKVLGHMEVLLPGAGQRRPSNHCPLDLGHHLVTSLMTSFPLPFYDPVTLATGNAQRAFIALDNR
jgi:hypothetical protein